MTRKTDSQPNHKIYQFEIEIVVRRMDSRYDTTNLCRVDIKREIPLEHDDAAKHMLRQLVTEEMDRSVGVVEAHITFENTVKQLTDGGDVIDFDPAS